MASLLFEREKEKIKVLLGGVGIRTTKTSRRAHYSRLSTSRGWDPPLHAKECVGA